MKTLVGTTWYFNPTITNPIDRKDIYFTSSGTEYLGIDFEDTSYGLVGHYWYANLDVGCVFPYDEDKWNYDAYRTITITGGKDATNAELIKWLRENAEQEPVYKIYDENKISAIAEKIREKTGNETTYKTSEMPSGVDEVYDAGYGNGYGVAYNYGFEAGKEVGRQLENDALWDILQDNGNRTSYQYAFAASALTWTDETYNPKYPIVCNNANVYTATALFAANDKITDTKVPITIDGTRADTLFDKCYSLKRIPSLTLTNIVRFSNTFRRCDNLETLIVHGTIDIDGFNVGDCKKLSRESIDSIVAALSTTTSGLTCTLPLDAVNKAYETSEGANDGSTSAEWIAIRNTKKNWTVSLI